MIDPIIKNRKTILVEDSPKDIELTKLAMLKANICNELNAVTAGVEATGYLLVNAMPIKDLPVIILLDMMIT